MLYTYLPLATKILKKLFVLGAELSILFLAICFLVTLMQQYLPQEKMEKLLGGKRAKGYLLAILLGTLTPFCSCSTIPLLKGLIKAKTGFGQLLTFLFISPLLNPIIVGLFLMTFGIQYTVIYVSIALLVAVSASALLNALGFEKYIIHTAQTPRPCACNTPQPTPKPNCCSTAKTSCCAKSAPQKTTLTINPRLAFKDTWQQFMQVLPFLLLGISVGACIYGLLPTELIVQYAGNKNPFAVPVAAVIGIPLYVRMEAVIPLTGMLAAKGMGLGAIMAFIIGSSGASVTELILLKSMFKWPLVAGFVSVVFGMAVLTGYLFQYVIAA